MLEPIAYMPETVFEAQGCTCGVLKGEGTGECKCGYVYGTGWPEPKK